MATVAKTDNNKVRLNISLSSEILEGVKDFQKNNYGIDQATAITIMLMRALDEIKTPKD